MPYVVPAVHPSVPLLKVAKATEGRARNAAHSQQLTEQGQYYLHFVKVRTV